MKEYLEEKIGLTQLLAAEEAARCLLCLDAPCSQACPAYTDPARFIRAIRFRNFIGGIKTIRLNNPLGGICARVCPTEKYCQQGCLRAGMDKPIDIGALQRFLTDYEKSIGYQTLEKSTAKKDRIAIIGSGPAGLSCANYLARQGYQVTIFEKHKRAGGYLTYGIPPYRLPAQVVEDEINHTLALGVKILYGLELGKDISLASLKVEGYKSVVIATGYDSSRFLEIFRDNPYVESATDFLSRLKVSAGHVILPGNLLIIGGGDVAMDVAVTAKKLGVNVVTAVARETMDIFPASRKEYAEAIENKVSIIAGFTPTTAVGNAVTFTDINGNGELTLKADKIVLAVGQVASPLTEDLQLNNRGDIAIDNFQTSNPFVFACGDITEGDKTVVYAVKKGKECAVALMDCLTKAEVR